jgi:hypothetical protein
VAVRLAALSTLSGLARLKESFGGVCYRAHYRF